MSGKRRGLGELELEVLKTVWDRPGRSVQDVADELGKRRGCARTTVLTVMQRLHAKGFLKRRKVGGVFRYSPTEGRSEVLSSLIGQFVDKVLDGSAAPFLTYLVDTKELSESQANQLRAIVKELECSDQET